MKKHKKIVIASLLLILAIPVLFWDAGVRMFIRANHQSLEAFAEKSLENADAAYARAQYGIWEASCWKDENMVEFYTGDFGIAPSSHIKGFYYSTDDVPIAFNATDAPLTTNGEGWRWEMLGNYGETERIIPRWFWYEAHF